MSTEALAKADEHGIPVIAQIIMQGCRRRPVLKINALLREIANLRKELRELKKG